MTLKHDVTHIADNIIERNPGPIITHLLMKEVIKSKDNLSALKNELENSIWVQELKREQRSDGGWGAFHSRSTREKQRIPSTEVGVERALVLGLDNSHSILKDAERHIIEILRGERAFPDYHEKNNRWNIGKNLFLDSTLSLINPNHTILKESRKLWLNIIKETFKNGYYDNEAEIIVHKYLTGASVENSYLICNSRYHLILMGNNNLPDELQKFYIDWIWNNPKGIGYLEIPLVKDPPFSSSGLFDRWFVSHELLSKFYPRTWSKNADAAINWLWRNQNLDGYWDFGSRAPTQHYFPLSDNWKVKQNRVFDWTTRVLILLRRYSDSSVQSR